MFRRELALCLLILTIFPLIGITQENAPQQPRLPAIETLRVIVLEGEGAVNNIPSRMATAPVVEIRDLSDRPVEGVEVTFRLPETGPSGYFSDQQLVRTVRTNLQGQATATFVPNEEAGRFQIRVAAKLGNRTGEAVVNQTNSTTNYSITEPRQRRRFGWRQWAIIGGVAAGAAIAAIILTGNGSDSNPTVVVTPGPIIIGGPR